MPPLAHEASAFGLRWRSDLPLDPFDAVSLETGAGWGTIDLSRNLEPRLPDRGIGTAINRGWVYPDGVRFVWEREVAFDMVGGDHVTYTPGPDWRGALPVAFYSTVAALILAWRGAIPFHACAVELDGKAILLAGPTGAGKSTLTAGLVSAGARFVSDDLTAVRIGADGNPHVWRGRPTVRLSRDIAARLDGKDRKPIEGDVRGKWQLAPQARTTEPSLPLAAIVLLGASNARTEALAEQLFRPRWLALMPAYDALLRDLQRIAASTPVIDFPAIDPFDPPDLTLRAAQAKALIEQALPS